MTDTFIYNGPISRGYDLDFMEEISNNGSSDKCKLILVTQGGDPDSAYKIGRYIQDCYQSFSILVSGVCKSAGTLLAISANELIFTPYGELGPLDVQMQKEDKIMTTTSGLNTTEAFNAIEGRAKDTYHSLIGEILALSDGITSLRTTLSAASDMVSSLYGPIFSQIDPEEVGSRSRAMRIGEEYALRLNSKWSNLKQEAIEHLSRKYPSHSFVIDFGEAKLLFENLRKANEEEINTVKELGEAARYPSRIPTFKFIENDVQKRGNSDDKEKPKGTKPGRRSSRQSNGGDSATTSGK